MVDIARAKRDAIKLNEKATRVEYRIASRSNPYYIKHELLK